MNDIDTILFLLDCQYKIRDVHFFLRECLETRIPSDSLRKIINHKTYIHTLHSFSANKIKDITTFSVYIYPDSVRFTVIGYIIYLHLRYLSEYTDEFSIQKININKRKKEKEIIQLLSIFLDNDIELMKREDEMEWNSFYWAGEYELNNVYDFLAQKKKEYNGKKMILSLKAREINVSYEKYKEFIIYA